VTNTFGTRFRVSIFGTSHGPFVGAMVEGIPPRTPVDLAAVQKQLDRRRPGTSLLTSQRKEEDRLEVAEGIEDGVATGEPIVALIRNADVQSKGYERYSRVPRPGHADFTALMKYRGVSDLRGGGQLSGRMTAPMVAAGAIARQVLEARGLAFYAHAIQIGSVRARPVPVENVRAHVDDTPVRCADLEVAAKMVEEIDRARRELDSVGGIIEATVTGVPVGLGEPVFDSVESVLSHLMFSIPAVKGVEFGAGFRAASMRGSEHNDPFVVRDGVVRTETNNAGGILGGITNGVPIVFRVVVKPTASIARTQKSVDLQTMTETEVEAKGRHDPCIVPRAVPVVENVAAIGLLDLALQEGFV